MRDIYQTYLNRSLIFLTLQFFCAGIFAQNSGAPRINGPNVFGANVGKSFICPVPISGAMPVTVTATGLPDGVNFDTKTNVISGEINVRKTYHIKLFARNKFGKIQRELLLKIGSGIALTPPMGWNSWYSYGRNVTQTKIELTAKLMKANGLQQLGWDILVVDDPWTNQVVKSDSVWSKLRNSKSNNVYCYSGCFRQSS